ncbi:MAG: alpha/beta hydrolase [Balneolaceae bacterium]
MRYTYLLILFCLFNANTGLKAQSLSCFDEYNTEDEPYRIERVTLDSDGVTLAVELYLPKERGNYPALLMLPGGGNNVQNLRNVPEYLGRRAAACGIVALFFDKRGTGNSTGEYGETDFNDFLVDASSAIDYLAMHSEVNTSKIGATGFSQGGRLIANLAVRNKRVSFIAGVSGPINKVGPNRYYAVSNSFDRTQLSDSIKAVIRPYWEEHFNALEARDTTRSLILDKKIEEAGRNIRRGLLPPYHANRDRSPIYNSMGIDLLTELENLTIPWYSIYGEDDPIVSAKESIANIERLMKKAGNTDYVIENIPDSNHAIYNPTTQKQYPFERKIIEWVLMITKS